MPNFGETHREVAPQPLIPDGSRYLMPLENPMRFEEDTDRESNEGSGIRYPDARQFDTRRRRYVYFISMKCGYSVFYVDRLTHRQ
jgi:hypothetical protein